MATKPFSALASNLNSSPRCAAGASQAIMWSPFSSRAKYSMMSFTITGSFGLANFGPIDAQAYKRAQERPDILDRTGDELEAAEPLAQFAQSDRTLRGFVL